MQDQSAIAALTSHRTIDSILEISESDPALAFKALSIISVTVVRLLAKPDCEKEALAALHDMMDSHFGNSCEMPKAELMQMFGVEA